MLAEEGVHPPNRVRIEPPPTLPFSWETYQKEQSCWSSSWLLGEILEPHSVRAGRCHRGCLSYCFILWGGNWGPEKGSNLLTEMLFPAQAGKDSKNTPPFSGSRLLIQAGTTFLPPRRAECVLKGLEIHGEAGLQQLVVKASSQPSLHSPTWEEAREFSQPLVLGDGVGAGTEQLGILSS